jgi:hypothetical protein
MLSVCICLVSCVLCLGFTTQIRNIRITLLPLAKTGRGGMCIFEALNSAELTDHSTQGALLCSNHGGQSRSHPHARQYGIFPRRHMAHATHVFPRICRQHILSMLPAASHLDDLQSFANHLVPQRIDSLPTDHPRRCYTLLSLAQPPGSSPPS